MFYSCNIYKVSDIDQMNQMIFNRYKIIYIGEDIPAEYANNSNVIIGKAFLPPAEAVEALLDNNRALSYKIYSDYMLYTDYLGMFVNIILAAAIKQVPIGIMFDHDGMNLEFDQMFTAVFQNTFGLVFGDVRTGTPSGVIDAYHLNMIVNNLYNADFVNYPEAIKLGMKLDINNMIGISKYKQEINPALGKDATPNDYLDYFNKSSDYYKVSGKILKEGLVSDV